MLKGCVFSHQSNWNTPVERRKPYLWCSCSNIEVIVCWCPTRRPLCEDFG